MGAGPDSLLSAVKLMNVVQDLGGTETDVLILMSVLVCTGGGRRAISVHCNIINPFFILEPLISKKN